MKTDVFLAGASVVSGLALFAVALTLGKGFGLSLVFVVGPTLYLVFSKRPAATELPASTKLTAIHWLVPALLLGFGLYSITQFLYARPLEYFVAVSAFVCLISAQIFSPIRSKSVEAAWLVSILILSIAIRLSLLYEFPQLVGDDPWYHAFLINQIVSNGQFYVPVLGSPTYAWDSSAVSYYEGFPVFHYLVATVRLVSDLPLKETLALTASGMETFSLVYVYMISRVVLSDAGGALLATLLVSVSSWYIVWGSWVLAPMSLGLVFFALMVWLLLNDKLGSKKRIFYGFFFITALALNYTHPIASLLGLLFLVGACIERVWRPGARIPERLSNYVMLILFAAVLLLGEWALATPFLNERLAALKAELGLGLRIGSIGPIIREWWHFELDNVGNYILLAFALTGFLVWVGTRPWSKRKLILLFSSSLLFVAMYLFPFVGVASIQPQRWYVFLYVLLAPAVVAGLRHSFRGRNGRTRLLGLLLIIGIFSFAMITSTDVNFDNPLYGTHNVSRSGSFYESEIRAAEFAASRHDRPFYVDADYTSYFIWVLREPAYVIDFSRPESFGDYRGLVLIRDYVFDHPTWLNASGTWVRHIDRGSIEGSLLRLNLLYSNGNVTVHSSSGLSTP